jgi:hypothetical protein
MNNMMLIVQVLASARTFQRKNISITRTDSKAAENMSVATSSVAPQRRDYRDREVSNLMPSKQPQFIECEAKKFTGRRLLTSKRI